jgi:hypothetical protein
LVLVLVITAALSHKAKEDNDHLHHHGHEHKHHEKTLVDEAKQFASEHSDEAKKIASTELSMMLMSFIYGAFSFILRWSIYITIAGGVIYYFVTKQHGTGAAAGSGAQGQRSGKIWYI